MKPQKRNINVLRVLHSGVEAFIYKFCNKCGGICLSGILPLRVCPGNRIYKVSVISDVTIML